MLLIIILNPILIYAHKTTHQNFTIYSSQPLSQQFLTKIDEAHNLVKKSELYNPDFKIEFCLNDGSIYPTVIEKLQGKAFGRGLMNKVVLYGNLFTAQNYVELNGYKWNLTELLAHEMIHCYEYKKMGFFKSNPIANHPTWVWEGYAEYIARSQYNSLIENIKLYHSSDTSQWAITLPDNTICPSDYYLNWLLVQYCMEVKKMNFTSLLRSTTSSTTIQKEMMDWFNSTKHPH